MVPEDLSSRQEWMSLLKEASKPSHKGFFFFQGKSSKQIIIKQIIKTIKL